MAEIKSIETSFTIKGINKAKYSIIEYIRVPLLLFRRLDISELVLAKITVDVYLVNNLRANILIRIDTIGPKGINIIITKRHAYITSCSI